MRLLVAAAVATAIALPAGSALAAWSAQGQAAVPAIAARVPAGQRPDLARGEGEDGGVVVGWQGSYFGDGREVAAYRVKRTRNGSETVVCEVPSPAHSCEDPGAGPTGAAYTVTPVDGAWTGAPSAPSNAPDSRPVAPTATPTPSVAPSPTPSASPTPSPSPSPSPTPSPSPSPSPSPRSSPS